jgi:mannose-6-phosphate isomerase-like protein (cupin superfamily)
MKTLEVHSTKKVKKGWGYELHIVNNDKYCGKILHFDTGCKMSTHYHLNKHETWYILNGVFQLSGINPQTAEKYNLTIKEGDIVWIDYGVVHSVYAINGGEIFEISTPDNIEDNYRVEKGDSQK